MSIPHHLHFINPILRHDSEQSFEFFQMLTIELRLSIWEYAVQQNRLLKVDIEPSNTAADAPAYSTTNKFNKVVSGSAYTITVQGFHCHSNLLRVNREARKVALRFYRVQIPCYLQMCGVPPRPKKISMLYFNPEHDILHVRAQCPLEYTLIAFLHDLRAHDPKDVGLQSVALDSSLVTELGYLKPLPQGLARTSFIYLLSRLQRIIWVASSLIGRGIMSIFSNLPTVGVRFIHSMPIMSAKSSFDILAPDPRPIQSELKYVATATRDPRESSLIWGEILGKWGIVQSRPAQQQVLFSREADPYVPLIHDAETAQRYLSREQKSWIMYQEERSSIVLRLAGRIPIEGPEELAKAVRPAFGFWLFPIEALKDPERSVHCWSAPVFDLRGHEPELALSHLY
ncbi:hypothetical protein BKA66DRAFT_468449 [Pyrenochaeta sp. MPI-SDFR-AT-0127]|nr:hypothetical protein BKA66DRAFT_468449 [Pyrenochaeta sp. MPI-SDFR-AT-0127]